MLLANDTNERDSVKIESDKAGPQCFKVLSNPVIFNVSECFGLLDQVGRNGGQETFCE